MMKIILNSENATVPTKGTAQSAGYDLYAAESGTIFSKDRKMIDTGIIIEIPDGYYGKISPRSGLALKYGIDVFAGVIDSDYRNNIKCILYNSGEKDFEFKVGDRIAQIIFMKYYNTEFEMVEYINETERKGGFGSTGK